MFFASILFAQTVFVPIALGAQALPPWAQVVGLRVSGSLLSNENVGLKELYGVVFDLRNDATTNDFVFDYNRVRGLIGQVATSGPGSVRGVHVHAFATTPQAIGILNGVNSQISAGAATARGYAYGVDSTGAPGIVDGLLFNSNLDESKFRYAINFAEYGSALGAFALLPLGVTDGKFLWNGNAQNSFYVTDNDIFTLDVPKLRAPRLQKSSVIQGGKPLCYDDATKQIYVSTKVFGC